ncbi:MAG: hypothetical protein LBJ74_01395 [Heliobacteriaceae bacterium]|nr:hypothetical protein [Heliobacteriaceae bacterium]
MLFRSERFLENTNLPKNLKKEYLNLLEEFAIVNLYSWFCAVNEIFKEEFFQKLKEKFNGINIKLNRWITAESRNVYLSVLKAKNYQECEAILAAADYSILEHILSFKNANNYKIISILGVKIKLKRASA